MQEKPKQYEESTARAEKLKRIRMAQAKSDSCMRNTEVRVGYPKPRPITMPKMPWSD